jgi:hypothetical protein
MANGAVSNPKSEIRNLKSKISNPPLSPPHLALRYSMMGMDFLPHETRNSPAAGAGSTVRERRRENRRMAQGKASLTVLDGWGTGSTCEIQTRDLSLSGISFLVKEPLHIGQSCRIDIQNGNGSTQSHLCEVVRSRLLSNGRYEVAVQLRKHLAN